MLPGYRAFPKGPVAVTDASFPDTVIDGVPVVSTPPEIDTTTADQLRVALLRASRHRSPVIVVDMTGTSFCDSSGIQTLAAAHRRALAEGGELRLVLPEGGTVPRILALSGVGRFIPCFTHLKEALAGPSDDVCLTPAGSDERTRRSP